MLGLMGKDKGIAPTTIPFRALICTMLQPCMHSHRIPPNLLKYGAPLLGKSVRHIEYGGHCSNTSCGEEISLHLAVYWIVSEYQCACQDSFHCTIMLNGAEVTQDTWGLCIQSSVTWDCPWGHWSRKLLLPAPALHDCIPKNRYIEKKPLFLLRVH